MPNVHLTPQMQEFAEREIATGAFANLSEVVRAGMRKLVEERGAAAFHALKADLNAAADELARGGGGPFDPRAWQPEAFEQARRRSGSQRWRRAISTGSGLVRWSGGGGRGGSPATARTFERIAAEPGTGRRRDGFRSGRSGAGRMCT